MNESYYPRLKKFLEESEVGHQMAAPLKQGCVVYTDLEGDDQKYELVKVKNKCVLRPRTSRRAELQFTFTRFSIDYLLEPTPTSVHDLMNRYFDCLLENDITKKAELKIRVSLLESVRKGYLKMLCLGGHRAIPTLVAVGIDIPHLIRQKHHH